MEIGPLTGALGAEILGTDLRDPDSFSAIREAFVEHSVIVIRDQSISPDDHLSFARRWGKINVNWFFTALPSHPEIAVVLKEADQKKAIGEAWHTDHAYDQIPALGSILHAIETPSHGGDTVFCSMAAAYEDLSPRFREILHGMKAWHSSRHVFGAERFTDESATTGRIGNADAATQDALHPVVIEHPLSGRKGLYVNPQFTTRIDGLSTPESDAILGMLYAHCQNRSFSAACAGKRVM